MATFPSDIALESIHARGELDTSPHDEDAISPVLNAAYAALTCGKVENGMETLMVGLSSVRQRCAPEEWDRLVHVEVLCHPVGPLVREDPFTRRSYDKPRGYPGDPALLDYMYGSDLPPLTSALGAAILQFNRDRQASRSVRSRRQILAHAIDQTAARVRLPRILAVGCGHLREAADSRALSDGMISEFVALDHDAEALRQVNIDFEANGVRTLHASLRSLLSQKLGLRDLDLIYVPGLYDYLTDRVATRLTTCLFDMLAPGGQLLIANFSPHLSDIGYMESFMAWRLVYRDPAQLAALSADIDSFRWSCKQLFWDEHENIVFLELTRRREDKQPCPQHQQMAVTSDAESRVVPIESGGPENSRVYDVPTSQAAAGV